MPPEDPASPPPSGEITALLGELREGDPRAWERLVALVYADLRRIARAHLRGKGRRETLQTTALVNEAYFRLARPSAASFNDRVHFLAVASRAMRQVLLDRVRARATAKRSANEVALDVELHHPAVVLRGDELLVLEAALVDLERLEPRLGRVVEMRFYGGMTAEEVGIVLGVSDRTVKSDWRKARAFLEARLAAEGIGPRRSAAAAEP